MKRLGIASGALAAAAGIAIGLGQPALAQPALAQPALAQPALAQPALAQPALAQPALAQPALAQPAGEGERGAGDSGSGALGQGALGQGARGLGDNGRVQAFARLPHWPGYWVAQGQEGTTIGGLAPAVLAARETGRPLANFMPLRAANAAWNEEGRRRLAAAQARAAGRKATGWGFPMMMNAATPIEFIITPEKVLIINAYNEARHVYLREAMFDKDDLWPSVLGTSVGRWEGDTLAIQTVMVKTPNDYFHGAPVFSEEATYLERIRMEGDTLVSEITITDPATLDRPFTTRISWVRDQGFDRMIQIDWDNDRTGVDADGINTIEEGIVP